MGCERHFLDPSRPALDLAAEFLQRDWRDGPLDLRTTLIVVPTRHAGRRLRERLALEAARRGTAVLSGPVVTPPRLFQPAEPAAQPLAAGVLAQFLWVETLCAAPAELLAALNLDSADSRRRCANAKAAGQHIVLLRETLCEEGYSLSAFNNFLREEHLGLEPERWEALAKLEELYVRTVEQHGFRDDVLEKLRAAQNPTIPPQITRVVVLFVPDPAPLSLTALEKISSKIPVLICVQADAKDGSAFDNWGRPLAEAWRTRTLSASTEQIDVCDDPFAMIERVRQLVSGFSSDQRSATTIGTADPLHAEVLAATLARENVVIFNPAGRSAMRLPLCTFLKRLFAFRREKSFRALNELAQHPYAHQRLARILIKDSPLADLDAFQNAHIPRSCRHAREIASAILKESQSVSHDNRQTAETVLAVLEEVERWLQPFAAASSEQRSLSSVLSQVLLAIFQDESADEQLKVAADLLRKAFEELRPIELLCRDLDEQCDWLLQILAATTQPPVRTPEAIELLGWLELAWEDAPILLLTDMNDGLVPETVPPNPFLPDNLRRAARLRGNDHRFARDAYVLECIVRSRPSKNIRFFVPRRSAEGHPLKPSRLLLQCASEKIAERAVYLFSDHAPGPVLLQRSPGVALKVPLPPQPYPLRSLPITSLRDYLADPLVFYLKHLLKMDEPFEEAFELDPLAFGSICHDVLHAFGASDVGDSRDEKEIGAFLEKQIEIMFARRFGPSPPVIVDVQRNLIRQRMRAFAKRQAKLRAEGWKIMECEHRVSLPLDGVVLEGRIDRMDVHEKERTCRIIDYKTPHKINAPENAHRKMIQANSKVPTFAISGDGQYGWMDLQLPLYALAWNSSKTPPKQTLVAYFALPDDPRETDLLEWADLNKEILEDALQCATRIIKRAKAGVFWPPSNARTMSTPFSLLFFDDVERHLDPGFVAEMQKRADDYDRLEKSGGGL